jgi:DNA-binding transcriptional LysR family regulator
MSVRTEQGSARDVLGHLRARKCEVAVARLLSEPEPDLRVEPLHYEKLLVVAGSSSKWVNRRRVRLADLVDEPWIQAEQEMEPGSPTLEPFLALGFPGPRVFALSHSLNFRYGLLATGRYLTMIPDIALHYAPRRASIRVLPIELPLWHRPTCVITLKERTVSPLARRFTECLHEIRKPLGKSGR